MNPLFTISFRILEDRKRKTEMAAPAVPGKKKKTVDTKKALSKGFGGIKVKGKTITKTKNSSEKSHETASESKNCPSPSNEPSSSSNPFGLDYNSDSDSD